MTTTPTTSPPPVDVAYEAHQAAEARVALLCELEERENEGETVDPAEWPPTAGPYCGCTTCDLREGLFAAWPVFLAGATEVLRGAGHDAAALHLQQSLTVRGYPAAA